MLRRLTPRELLEQVAADWEPVLRAAWSEAIDQIRSNIVLRRLVEKLDRGDVAGAIADLGIRDEIFARFENALIQTYHGGGLATVNSMPSVRDPSGGLVNFAWGVRNQPGEQAMRAHAARLVTGIVYEARDGIASILTDNLARGQSPYEAARFIAGRVNRVNGTREGGLIGLSRPQMETVARIERAMRDGDVAYMRQYLTFANRDKRLDRTVLKAIADGRGLKPEEASRLTRLYANKALKYRGDTISILETHSALSRSKRDAFQHQIDEGKLDADLVTKKWRRTVSREPRMEHLMMARKEAIPFNALFTLPDGIQCTGPHDPNLPARHVVGCKCSLDIVIDFTGQAMRRYQERTGG